jgi:hypothetical protein
MARVTHALVALAAALVCTGCPNDRAEGPPPAESFEIASAAPGALGALAAGTDAAPPVVQATPEEALGEEEESAPPDAGSADGGMEPPENLPL